MQAAEQAQEVEAKEIVPFTHKVLVTFNPHVCLPINGTSTFVAAAICEFTESDKSYREEVPCRLNVVALPDRPPLSKALRIYLSSMHIVSAVFLDDDDTILRKTA